MMPLAFLALTVPVACPQLARGMSESSGAEAAPAEWIARVTEGVRHEEYGFSPLGSGAFGAPNRAQELRSRVSSQGLEVFPRSSVDGDSAPWRLTLRTRCFGRTDGELEL